MCVTITASPQTEIKDFSACKALQTYILTWTVSSSQAGGGISLSHQAGCNQPCTRALDHSECEFILKVR